MPERRSESQLGLEFSGFSMWHFLQLVVRGFLWVHCFPSRLYQLMVLAKEIQLKYMGFQLGQT